MKTATVADLRNRFAAISRWIHEGEVVTIQKRGKSFAVLSPVEKGGQRKKTDFEARLNLLYPNGPIQGEDITEYLRGSY
jgi:antitoxin (DNA-binding transcriptional repressor) of toxin-antitoxin stability system